MFHSVAGALGMIPCPFSTLLFLSMLSPHCLCKCNTLGIDSCVAVLLAVLWLRLEQFPCADLCAAVILLTFSGCVWPHFGQRGPSVATKYLYPALFMCHSLA